MERRGKRSDERLLRLRGFSPKTRTNTLLTSGVQNVKTITQYLYISFEQVLQCSFYNSVHMYYNLVTCKATFSVLCNATGIWLRFDKRGKRVRVLGSASEVDRGAAISPSLKPLISARTLHDGSGIKRNFVKLLCSTRVYSCHATSLYPPRRNNNLSDDHLRSSPSIAHSPRSECRICCEQCCSRRQLGPGLRHHLCHCLQPHPCLRAPALFRLCPGISCELRGSSLAAWQIADRHNSRMLHLKPDIHWHLRYSRF
jgi:hypothetical protein